MLDPKLVDSGSTVGAYDGKSIRKIYGSKWLNLLFRQYRVSKTEQITFDLVF